MKNKKSNAASTFADALEAMNDATGNGTGENEMYITPSFFLNISRNRESQAVMETVQVSQKPRKSKQSWR